MRWIKAMIITVLVLAIIPTIVLSINKITGGKTKRVEYEITITWDNITETVHEINNIAKIVDIGHETMFPVTNFLYVEYDGRILNNAELYYYEYSKFKGFYFVYYEGNDRNTFFIDLYDPFNNSSSEALSANVIKVVLYDDIAVQPLSPTEIILISLIPLILVSGLLIYQYKELGLKIRKE